MHIYTIPPGPCDEMIKTLRNMTEHLAQYSERYSALICILTAAQALQNPETPTPDLEMAGYPTTD